MSTIEDTGIDISKRKETFIDWVLDLLIYIVVLNLFVEYSDAFYIETFTISIFTAFVLKAALSTIISFEHKVSAYFKKKKEKIYKYINVIAVFSILFLSKFVILELINIIFGTRVEIYGFIPLVALIITLIATRKIIEYIYNKL